MLGSAKLALEERRAVLVPKELTIGHAMALPDRLLGHRRRGGMMFISAVMTAMRRLMPGRFGPATGLGRAMVSFAGGMARTRGAVIG
jgi:hypothetical protein